MAVQFSTVANLANPATYGFHDPVDADTVREITTRYDARHRPTARTVWLVPRGLVDPNNPPIAGLDGVPPSEGLTTRYYYDDNLTDALGLDGGLLINKIDGSGSFTLNISQLLAELTADGVSLGADSDGSATVTLNGQDEISVSLSDGLRRGVARGIIAQAGTPLTWTSTLHDALATITGFGDVLETTSIDALNHTNKSRTDGLGRSIESVDAENFVSTFSSDANGNQLAVRDPNNVGQDCIYDELNRDLSCTDTQGDTTSRDYDAASNIVKTTDAKLVETFCTFDARDRQVQCTNRIGSVTQWSYDANSNLLSLLDGDNFDVGGDATVYTYDARNLKISEAFPGHGPTSNIGDADYDLVGFSYDAAGRILVKTDQQGDLCTFNYDLAGRLTSRDYLGGPLSPLVGQSDSDLFVYDAAGRMTAAISGRYNNSVAMAYDAASRLVGESLTAFAQTYTVGSGFDAANRKTSITYPDGTLVNRAYTDRNQLQEVKYAGAIIDTRTYDSGGRLSTSLYGNNIGTTWSYRADNLTASITRTNLTGADFSYTYDANKNKTSETISGVMSPYGFLTTSYDSQDRLTSWNRTDGALNQSWNLSPVGDWTSFTQNGVAQPRTHTSVHELTAINTTPLLYDSKGNLTQNSNSQTYSWDFDNRLSSATVPVGAPEGIEGTHAYSYDALGRRVSKSIDTNVDGTPDQTAVFVCMILPLKYSRLAGQVLAEYPSGELPSSPDRKYAHATFIDEPILLIDRTSAGAIAAGTDEPFYYHQNNLFSVAALTDSVGSVTERYAYTTYGIIAFFDANGALLSAQTSAFGNRYSYTGRRLDEETNLRYYRARYYDSGLGRFIGRDPIGFRGGMNRYRFVACRPVDFVDPSGKSPFESDPSAPYFPPKPKPYPKPKPKPPAKPPWYANLSVCPTTNPDDSDGSSGGMAGKIFQNKPVSPIVGDDWCSEGANPLHHPATDCFRSYNPMLPKCLAGCEKHTGSINSENKKACISKCRKEYFGPGQQCCYDCTGKLITSGSGAGTPDIIGIATGEYGDGSCMEDLWWKFGLHGYWDVLPYWIDIYIWDIDYPSDYPTSVPEGYPGNYPGVETPPTGHIDPPLIP